MNTSMREPGCDGPAYDAQGELSAKCRLCGKCDALDRLMRELAPVASAKNETMRPASPAAR